MEAALNVLKYDDLIASTRNKDKLIRRLLKAVDQYLLGKIPVSKYGIYKRAVVVGFICSHLGIFKTQEQHDDANYNEYLNDRVKQIQKSYRKLKS